jgi:hypothetical protein
VVAALQGAFAEHQAMLKRLSGKGKRLLETIEVRTPEDLKRCDALIIPGGGTADPISSHPFLFVARLAKAFVLTTPHVSLPRVNHHRAACAFVWVNGTAPGVCQDEIGVGHLRGRDTPRASRVQFEVRRTGAPWRRLSEDCKERLGITGASSLLSPFLVGRTEMID